MLTHIAFQISKGKISTQACCMVSWYNFQFGKSQRSRTRSRSGSRTPPLLPRKGSLKKVNKENRTFLQGNRVNTRGNHLTRTSSVHFEDAAKI